MHNHHHSMSSEQMLKKKIEFLDSQNRRNKLPPEEILKQIDIKKQDVILDIGAGTGYLTIPAAKSQDAPVYALDIDAQMLKIIEMKAQNENISNIQYIKGSLDPIPLNNNSVDVVLASLILHEVNPLTDVLKQISQVLKEGGRFLCLEYEKDDTQEGPPMHIRIPSAFLEEELKKVGFEVIQKVYPMESIYIMTAEKVK